MKKVGVEGFKCFREATSLDFGGVTLLCGQNSSGKSSFLQPLLLLKQTSSAPIDAGALDLAGPNIRFERAEELFWHGKSKADSASAFAVTVAYDDDFERTHTFKRSEKGRIELDSVRVSAKGLDELTLKVGEKPDPKVLQRLIHAAAVGPWIEQENDLRVVRAGCDVAFSGTPGVTYPIRETLTPRLAAWMHVPGLRGNPERAYRAVARPEANWPGWFHDYTAGILRAWTEAGASDDLKAVGDALRRLGLTWKVAVKNRSDTHVSLQVGRTREAAQGGSGDLVNIADVGFGVSQVLPVVVALRVATGRNVVQIEQPELHLHPEAQFEMGRLIYEAAANGVQVIVETHSMALVRGLQTARAASHGDRMPVWAHWFTRNADGSASVASSAMAADGALADLPEDLSKAAMDADIRFLDASFART